MTQLEKSEVPVNHYVNNKQLVKEVDNNANSTSSSSSCCTQKHFPSTSAAAKFPPKVNGAMEVKNADAEATNKAGQNQNKSDEKTDVSSGNTSLVPYSGPGSSKKARLASVTTSATPIPLPAPSHGNAYGGNQSFVGLDSDLNYTNGTHDQPSSPQMLDTNFTSPSIFGPSSKMPGAVGFGNLGNTCFMNAGLQCLVNTPPVVEFFLKSPNITGVSPNKAPLTSTFQQLIRSAWQGSQSVLHPREFKDTLGNTYSQFKDTRQHDCQEFLALTLDVLHEQLKVWNNVKRENTNETSSSGFASGAPESGSGCSESPSIVNDSDVSSSLQSPGSNGEVEPNGHEVSDSKKRRLTDDSEVTTGTGTTDATKSQSSSPVKEESSEGEHEPQQAEMQVDENEEGDVESGEDALDEEEDKGRRALKEKAKQAEGFWMNYIRDNNTVIASSFQGMYKSTVTCSVCNFISCTYEPFMYLSLPIPRTTEREFDVTYSALNDFQIRNIHVTMNINDNVGKLKEKVITTVYQEIGLADPPSSNFVVAEIVNYHIQTILKDDLPLKNVKDGIYNVYVFELNQNFCDSSMAIAGNVTSDFSAFQTYSFSRPQTYLDEDWETDTTTQSLVPSTSGGGFIPENGSGDDFISADLPAEESTCKEDNQDELITCSVCLEELSKSKLKQHYGCSCILCEDCILKTAECLKPSGNETVTSEWAETTVDTDLKCPVCSEIVDYKKCFIPLITSGDGPRKLNLIPVIFHYNAKNDSNNNSPIPRFIGHPLVVQLPSTLPANEFHDFVRKLVPFPESDFAVKNACWTGKECGACVYNRTCTGCEFRNDGIISINSRNSILISFSDLSVDLIASIQPSNMATCTNPHSTSYLSSSWYKEEPIIDIYECLDAFSKTEYLDDQNPWFCPSCKERQCATKSLTICRFPDYLIVYLKRFVFVDNSSNKLNNKLKFPINEFDVSKYIAEEFAGGEQIYDLYSCVCHYGSAIGGHYTSFSKNPKFNAWHYFNDDTVTDKCPSSSEYESAYVLFYAKKGLKSDIPLKSIPQFQVFTVPVDIEMKDVTRECDTTTVVPSSKRSHEPDGCSSSNQEDTISSTSADLPDSADQDHDQPASVPSSASSDKVNHVGENVSNLCIDINRRKRAASTTTVSGTPATSTSTHVTSFEFENEFDESPTIKPYAEFAIENKRLTKIAQRSKFTPNTHAPSTSGLQQGPRKHF